MTRVAPLVAGLLVAAVCVRLAFWQLDRLAQRGERNATIERRLALPPITLATALPDLQGDSLHGRRAVAVGVLDTAYDVVEVARPRQGAPGVHVLTPLRLADGGAVLVVRGWVYSPDGRTVDLAPLAETGSTSVTGVLLRPSDAPQAIAPGSLHTPYPLLPLVLRRTEAPPTVPSGMVVLDPPVIEQGPHLSYAVQWFVFASIALGGGVVLYARHRPT